MRNAQRHVERRADVALSGQVVDFIRPNFEKNRDQAVYIKDVAVVHMELQRGGCIALAGVKFLVKAVHEQMLYAALVERRRVALDAVHFITLKTA
jgi:RNase P/RNase MRP subunit p29